MSRQSRQNLWGKSAPGSPGLQIQCCPGFGCLVANWKAVTIACAVCREMGSMFKSFRARFTLTSEQSLLSPKRYSLTSINTGAASTRRGLTE